MVTCIGVGRTAKEVRNLIMNREEALGLTGRFEALHDVLPPPVGRRLFSARLFKPLCWRCSTPGITAFFAAA